jgi:hypothetical protein
LLLEFTAKYASPIAIHMPTAAIAMNPAIYVALPPMTASQMRVTIMTAFAVKPAMGITNLVKIERRSRDSA